MPWKVSAPMSQRTLFVAEYLRDEISMAELCRHYGISRKTGYKWVDRVQEEGEDGLRERSRAPHHCPHQLDDTMIKTILDVKNKYPPWGPRKIRTWLMTKYPRRTFPAASTIGEVLKRHGLIVPRRSRRSATPTPSPLTVSNAPGHIMTVDFKGHFRTANGRKCTPLTIADDYSRFVLRCQALDGHTGFDIVQPIFEATFREYGLPSMIRSDNGPPFATVGLGGLSRLSVWWMRLGIHHERIEPGHPEQNGRHERMHRTLKAETTKPPGRNAREQQRRFDEFCRVYNYERPHEGLDMKVPADFYLPSPRAYPCPLLGDHDYPYDWLMRKVRSYGNIKFDGKDIRIGMAFVGEYVGFCPTEEDGWWDIYYRDCLLAHFDERKMRLTPAKGK